MMMREGSKIAQLIFITALVLATSSQTFAAVMNAGLGLPHTKSAYTILQGRMAVTGNLRFWGGTGEYANGDKEGETRIWVARSVGNLTYAFSKHGVVSLSPIVYQDAHKKSGEQIPWDTFLHFKFGNFKVEQQPYWIGFDVGMRFPTGKKHNVIFEDYTAGKFEFGLTGILTYRYTSPQLKNDVRVHANLGYWNHNDKDVYLSEVDPRELGYVKHMSQSLRYALGVEFPVEAFVYGLEIYGMSWLLQPPAGASSRENYFYMNVSGNFKAHHRISIFASADLRLSPGKDTTRGFEPDFKGIGNYPGWRINVGLRYLILPRSLSGFARASLEHQQKQKTRELYSQLRKELEKRKQTDAELERLKHEKEKSQSSSKN
jgi:hypothetical protein